MGLRLEVTAIPGLLVLRLPVHVDHRGWFKENWQRENMVALGLPDFGPVQHNVSFNTARGTTRGVHTEPWDKLVSVVTGRVFAAWVDMRAGATFGTTVWLELDPGVAVFVPRGVGNSYQTLEDQTTYSYLVNEHWRPGIAYPALALDDTTAAIPWPIPLAESHISEKDHRNPSLDLVEPMAARRTLVIGRDGQVGRALTEALPEAVAVSAADLDLTDPRQIASWPWSEHDVVLNAAAFTAVDAAETDEGRRAAWAVNASAPAAIAGIAAQRGLVLVHYSSDYVFDGTAEVHAETEPLSPLGVYGQAKAAGDLAVAGAPRHYLLRTSWVVGEGKNFVRTMHQLAREGASPTVVDDQVGRLTFATELARATRHLLDVGAPYGTYNVSSSGPSRTWAALARRVFELVGRDPRDVTTTTTQAWAEGRLVSPRPRSSTLDLSKLEATGFVPADEDTLLQRYLEGLVTQ